MVLKYEFQGGNTEDWEMNYEAFRSSIEMMNGDGEWG